MLAGTGQVRAGRVVAVFFTNFPLTRLDRGLY